MSYVYLALFSLLLSMGQILFKKAAIVSNLTPGLAGFVNPWLMGAVCLYGLTTILWVWILKTVPLSIAYPFSALGFVLVPLAATYFFGETISIKYIVGGCMIVAGILIIGGTSQGFE